MNGWVTVVGLALLVAGCGGSTPTKPEDMSAAEHERAARKHEVAAEHRASVPRAGKRYAGDYVVNPSHVRHAQEHRDAAKELRAEEAEACAGVAEAERATCPLMAHAVTAVEELPTGVRVTFSGADAAALGREAECHRTHGATEGREGMPSCPLYNRGLTVTAEPTADGATLTLTSDDPATVAILRQIYTRTPSE